MALNYEPFHDVIKAIVKAETNSKQDGMLQPLIAKLNSTLLYPTITDYHPKTETNKQFYVILKPLMQAKLNLTLL